MTKYYLTKQTFVNGKDKSRSVNLYQYIVNVILDQFSGNTTPTNNTPQVVQQVTIPLSVAQLLAIHTTPVQILPALPTGQCYLPLNVTLKCKTKTNNYSGNGNQYYVVRESSAWDALTGFISIQAFTSAAVNQIHQGSGGGATIPLIRTNAALVFIPTPGASAFALTGGTGTTYELTLNYIIQPI